MMRDEALERELLAKITDEIQDRFQMSERSSERWPHSESFRLFGLLFHLWFDLGDELWVRAVRSNRSDYVGDRVFSLADPDLIEAIKQYLDVYAAAFARFGYCNQLGLRTIIEEIESAP